MNLIKEKKINGNIVNFVLYLSFCFAGWYSSRASVASVIGAYEQFSFMANDIFAFLIAGIVPILIYILVIKIFSRALKQVAYLPVDQMVYAFPFFYIGANIVIGLFNVLYYFLPIASIWGEIIVPLVATACFFIWFLAFICKNYIKKYNWKTIIVYFGRIYLVVAILYSAFGLIMAVIL